jgi:hypothetical protein
MFIDNDFPKLLGAELYRPHPAYVVEMACEPVVVHDFTKQPGQTVQLDRYRFFGNPGTKTSRERTQDQTIGTANSRSIVNLCVSTPALQIRTTPTSRAPSRLLARP